MSRRPRRNGRRRAPVARPGMWLEHLDGAVVTPVAILCGLGLLMVYSATATLDLERLVPPHFVRQLGACLAGLAVAAAAAWVPLAWWERAALPLWAGAVLLLGATLLAGVEVNGARRWLALPSTGVAFQPAEVTKWAAVVAAARVLAPGSGRTRPDTRRCLAALGLAALPAALVMAQPDLGNAVLLVGLVAVMLFVAGAPLRFFAVPVAVAGAALGVHLALRPYALERFRGFLDPWGTARDQGFQLVQSFVGFSRGGLFGAGLGDGRQKLFYLPEAHTDFILAVVAEELGLAGVLVVLGAFAALGVAGTRLAQRARGRFAALLAVGMTALLVVPALVNAAVVTGMVPTKGMALPWMSYGRTHVLVAFAALGVLLGVGLRGAPPGAGPVSGAARGGAWR